MKEWFVNKLQQLYDKHRAPETWGTPQVSPGFFDRLRSEGLLSAWNYLVEKEGTMGNPFARPEIKAMANLLGSTLLIFGARNMALSLLFFAQGEGTYSHMGYLGKDPSQWDKLYSADLTLGEQEEVERQFDPRVDGCLMDTIARIYPDKLKIVSEEQLKKDRV